MSGGLAPCFTALRTRFSLIRCSLAAPPTKMKRIMWDLNEVIDIKYRGEYVYNIKI
jgi:hypothetical protein